MIAVKENNVTTPVRKVSKVETIEKQQAVGTSKLPPVSKQDIFEEKENLIEDEFEALLAAEQDVSADLEVADLLLNQEEIDNNNSNNNKQTMEGGKMAGGGIAQR